ncbi:MAG TPA: tRNA (adenosine(37)-N6)-threonylcarbamoyltransferase complex ATPase subunit type 1 TsaE [Methylomirabilota bacterium]|nr:tRNA (adenosine(37)-N6)-threonylcarbamoyltransferase complex ATPase subunit type 1 TsaE [Methylomirabilota bacterium]
MSAAGSAGDAAAAGGTVTVTCASPEATRALAAGIGRRAAPGMVVALSGDLGAGKTCFIQGLASGLGIAGPVTSPTFVLIAEYTGRLPLYHVDLYRTESLGEIRALGLEEMLDGGGITAIEWAEKAEPLLPSRTVRVRIRGAGDEPRTVEIDGAPADWMDRA